MKALTLTQPWATLVAIGEKQIETRSWSTPYRGPIAIHAAKGLPGGERGLVDVCMREPFRSVLAQHSAAPPWHWLPRGAIVATAVLVDCLPIAGKPIKGQHCIASDGEDPLIRVWHPTSLAGVRGHYSDITTEHDLAFGDYTPGRFGWLLTECVALPEPIPARGALGLWEWDP